LVKACWSEFRRLGQCANKANNKEHSRDRSVQDSVA
jgi:hypothetical protein